MTQTESDPTTKRLEELKQERARRKRKQKEDNKRLVCIRKKTAKKVEKMFRQYPKQPFAEIVDRCLKWSLEHYKPSDPQNNLQ